MTPADLKRRTRRILTALSNAYPDARCMLDYRNAYELLIATVLAAQCTDRKVNEVTVALFAKYPSPADLARAKLPTLEKEIRPTGFFRQKSKSIVNAAKAIVEDHGGEVPGTIDALTKLPGVGRKTANVVLGECFDQPGIIVDTHFKRVTTLLGLTKNTDPDKIEADLDALVPKRKRLLFSHLITFHGRAICIARRPRCDKCTIRRWCNWYATQKT